MRYIIANTELVRQVSGIDLPARKQSKNGMVMLNEKDLSSIFGESFEDKLLIISGTAVNENEAVMELSKEEWK